MARVINFDKKKEIVEEKEKVNTFDLIKQWIFDINADYWDDGIDFKKELEEEERKRIEMEMEEARKQREEAMERARIEKEEREKEERLQRELEMRSNNFEWEEFQTKRDISFTDFWELDEWEFVKKVFSKSLVDNKSYFKNGFSGINFSYENVSLLYLESLAITELNASNNIYEDTLLYKLTNTKKTFKVPHWESIYDCLSRVKWNSITYIKLDEVEEKECSKCYGTWDVTCPNCRWEKELVCRMCSWEWTIQKREYERKLVEVWTCNFCWWTKARMCQTCNWQMFLVQKCMSCNGIWKMQDWSVCKICQWSWQMRAACGWCKGSWKVHCNECNQQWKIMKEETKEVFKTIKCENCGWRWRTSCEECFWEWEIRCSHCQWDWNVLQIREYYKEFDLEKNREMFTNSHLLQEDLDYISKMQWVKVNLPLNEDDIERYLNSIEWWKGKYNAFVQMHQKLESKKKSIVAKWIKFNLWKYSYEGNLYRVFIQWDRVIHIELPETSSGKIIKSIVSTGFIAKWVLWNLFGKKKPNLQDQLDEFEEN